MCWAPGGAQRDRGQQFGEGEGGLNGDGSVHWQGEHGRFIVS